MLDEHKNLHFVIEQDHMSSRDDEECLMAKALNLASANHLCTDCVFHILREVRESEES